MEFEFDETRISIRPESVYAVTAVSCTGIIAVVLALGLSRIAEFHRVQPLLLLPVLAATFTFGGAGAFSTAAVAVLSGLAAAIFSAGGAEVWVAYAVNTFLLCLAAWGCRRIYSEVRVRQVRHYHFLNARNGEVDFLRAQIAGETQLAETLRGKSLQWQRLSAAVEAVTASLTPDRVMRILNDEIRKLFPGRTAGVVLKNSAGADAMAAAILNRNQNILITDLDNDFRFRHPAGRAAFRSYIGVPILENSAPIGVLSVTDPAPEAFDMDHLRLLFKFSEIAAVILRNADIFEKTDRIGRMDGLTGLYKRWYFQNRFDEMRRLARRTGTPLSVMMVDIDFFKKINDSFGHPEGDRVLKGVAERFRAVFESKGMTARYGGEEFIAAVPALPEADVMGLAENFRSEVDGRSGLGVTISCGVAAFPRCPDLDTLIETADRALYRAKESGRNRVMTGENPRGTRPKDGSGMTI